MARRTCEICGVTPSPIFGDPLICHEVWLYDDKRGTATLANLRIQCGKCDSAVHMGRTVAHGGREGAISQLRKINGMSTEEAENLYLRAMAVWKKRSKRKWRIVVARPLLKRYPQLVELLENLLSVSRGTPREAPPSPGTLRAAARVRPLTTARG